MTRPVSPLRDWRRWAEDAAADGGTVELDGVTLQRLVDVAVWARAHRFCDAVEGESCLPVSLREAVDRLGEVAP